MAEWSRCAGRGQSSGQTRNLAGPEGGVSAFGQPEGSRRPRVGRGREGRPRVGSCERTALLPSASVTWGEAERDRVTPVSIQGKGEASTRPECPPRPLPGLPLRLRGAQGPPPPAPTSPGVLPPMVPRPLSWGRTPDPCTLGPTLPAQGGPGILRGSGTQTTGWSGSPSLGPGPGRLK